MSPLSGGHSEKADGTVAVFLNSFDRELVFLRIYVCCTCTLLCICNNNNVFFSRFFSVVLWDDDAV